jgi:hypothetical protein
MFVISTPKKKEEEKKISSSFPSARAGLPPLSHARGDRHLYHRFPIVPPRPSPPVRRRPPLLQSSSSPRDAVTPPPHSLPASPLSYGPPWAHYLGGYQDRLLGGSLGLLGLRYTAPEGVEHKDYTGVVLG